FLPGRARPVVPGLARGVDRLLHVLRAALVHVGEDVILVVRHDGLEGLARPDLLAADDERDLDPLALHLGEPLPQLLALGRAGAVVADGLVPRLGKLEDARRAHAADSRDGRAAATHKADCLLKPMPLRSRTSSR